MPWSKASRTTEIELSTAIAEFLGRVERCFEARTRRDGQSCAGMTLDQAIEVHVKNALARNGGCRKDAARELGISARTMFRYLHRYKLE